MRTIIRMAVLIGVLTSAARAQVTLLDEVFAYDQTQPAAGHWVGAMLLPERPGVFMALLVEPAADGEWSVAMTFLPMMAIEQKCEKVRIGGEGSRSIAFELASSSQPIAFEGTVSADGQRIRGSIVSQDPAGEQRASFEVGRAPRPADLPEPMAFGGTLSVRGMGEMAMTVVLAETPGGAYVGHLDVPAQMLRALPLVNIERDGRSISATVPSPGAPAVFDVQMDEDKQRLSGQFRQAGMAFDIDFERNAEYVFSAIARPQLPVPPFPYETREVTAEHSAGHRLAGTLTIPDPDVHGAGPYPTAVLISGSGAQDRDESLVGHKPFLVLADHLTRRGIAVMRYDDRGVGESTGLDSMMTATTADFATDTSAVVDALHAAPEVDADRIGLIGHSEGGTIAPMVARDRDDIAFLVLLAGTGVPGLEIIPLQMSLGMRAEGASAEQAERFRTQMATALQLLLADAKPEEVRAAFEAAARTNLEITGQEPSDDAIGQYVLASMTMMASPWMRYFLEYDPRSALAAVRCPTLAMNGTLDLQVWHKQNLDAIERTLADAGVDVTARRYDGLNHLFQPATTGSGSEYATIEITFDAAAMDDIAMWIAAKTAK